MAPYPRLVLPVLVVAASFAEGFVPPVAIRNGGGSLRSRSACLPQAVAPRENGAETRRSSWSSCRPRPRPDTRQHAALGPDGREIDIIRHREAYSYVEYWDDFYAG